VSNRLRVIIIVLLALVVFWVLDSALHTTLQGGENFWSLLWHPSPTKLFIKTGIGLALGALLALVYSARRQRRKSGEELAAQMNLYRTVVDASPDCVLVHRDFRVIYANRRALEFFGLEEIGAFQNAFIFNYILPQYQSAVGLRAERALQGETTPLLEIKVRKLDGEIRTVAVSSTGMNWAGEAAVLTFMRDITEEMRNKRDLLASRERLQLALDAAQDGVWDWDIPNGRMVYSESWANMLGFQLDELSTSLDTWRSLIHPDDYLRAQTLVDNHLQGFVPNYVIEVRLRHKKGHYIWILDRGRVVERDENGEPLRMTGTHRNITARKEAELALEIRNSVAEAFLTEETDELFQLIIDLIGETMESPLGFFATVDERQNLRVMATRPVQVEGNRDEVFGSLIFERDKLPDIMARVVDQNRYVLQNSPLELDAHQFPVDKVLGVPISSRDKVLGALFLANKDGGYTNTDRAFLESLAGFIAPILASHLHSEAQETKLRQAQKMEALGALAGGIAHDFNNILQAIMGFTTLALEDADPEGTIPGDLERVLRAARRGQDLVQRILLFSRREEQKLVPTELQTAITEAVNLLHPSIPATIEIRTDLNAEGAMVLGDPSQISQIVLNLATNAYHAMQKSGGVLGIALQRLAGDEFHHPVPLGMENQDLLVLSISDTGAGMSQQVRSRLFDPFFTTKEVGQGTGLGMSVVHGIVKAHGGEIEVQSELEIGTTVTLFFPELQEKADSQEDPERGNLHLPRVQDKHIVIVDDERDITDIGKALLERHGHRVTPMNNGRTLLEQVEADPTFCDLVITDLTMPQITGVQLAERLNTLSPDLPVILITGMSGQKGFNPQLHPNIKGLVHKPFGGDELRSVVNNILQAPH
jgi:PAS domain S-box-containing protein